MREPKQTNQKKEFCHISTEFVAPRLHGLSYYTPAVFIGKCN